MKFSYVLPNPSSYRTWDEFDGNLAHMKAAGYDTVELQFGDPAEVDEARLNRSLQAVGYSMCAFQTGSSYYTRGNCLCTADSAVRTRTIDLVRRFIDLAARTGSVIVFGSLQGKKTDEPDLQAGKQRIVHAISEIAAYAAPLGVKIALEPVNHEEMAYHNTIASVIETVRGLNLPSLRMMIDTFHMNIEEKDMLAPLAGIADVLVHVHLSETNRDVLGQGHWDTSAFVRELDRLDFQGCCSVGVYNTHRARRECMDICMAAIKRVRQSGASTKRRATP